MELKYGLRQKRAAKKGAKGVDSSAVAMEIGLADIHAKLTEQAWRQWGEEFHSRAAANERDDVPTYIARIMHRLHVGCWRLMCIPKNCECGNAVSFHQVLFSCTTCSDHLKPLTGSLHNAGLPLCTQSLSVRHQREGWSLPVLQPDWSTRVQRHPIGSVRDSQSRSTLLRSLG